MTPKAKLISEIFTRLRDEHVKFLVLRNFEDIPENCTIQNDIDLLAHADSMPLFNTIFHQHGFIKEVDKDIYFYNTKPHTHFYLYRKDIHFDIVNGLYYRSLNNARQWVPIHEKLQKQIFANKIYDENTIYFYIPSLLDQFLHLVCHCIFDNRQVEKEYKYKLEELITQLNIDKLRESVQLIFFKFSNDLIKTIQYGETELLYHRYITFTGY